MNSFGIRDDSLHERDGFVDDPSGKDEWMEQERGEKSEDGGRRTVKDERRTRLRRASTCPPLADRTSNVQVSEDSDIEWKKTGGGGAEGQQRKQDGNRR